jgi:hypothetical protein
MKNTGLVWLLLVGIMVTGGFVGCRTASVENREPNKTPVNGRFRGPNGRKVPDITVGNKEPMAPLVPITQSIINLAENSGKRIDSFQYYISAPITLERNTTERSMEITYLGEGLSHIKNSTEQISIATGTKGVFYKDTKNPNSYVLEICFDNDNKKNTLRFMRYQQEPYFYLVCNRFDNGTPIITYGNEDYTLIVTGNTPYLLIRYKEDRRSNVPIIRQPTGRPIHP